MTGEPGRTIKSPFRGVILFCLLFFLHFNQVTGSSRPEFSPKISIIVDFFSGCYHPSFPIIDSSDVASIQVLLKDLKKRTIPPDSLASLGLSCSKLLSYPGMVLDGAGDPPPIYSSVSSRVRICGDLIQYDSFKGTVYYHDKKKELQNLVIKIGTKRNLKSVPKPFCGQVSFTDLVKHFTPPEYPLPSWNRLITTEERITLPIRDLALSENVSPSSEQKILWAAAGDSGLYSAHYKDYTYVPKPTHWRPRGGVLGENAVLCVAALNRTVFLGTRDEGVFRSDDCGSSWSLAVSGLPVSQILGKYEPVEKILIRDRTVFAIIPSKGIYMSTMGKSIWEPFGPKAYSFTSFDMKGSEILAATFLGDLYRSDDSGFSWNSSSIPELNKRGMTVSQVNIGDGVLHAVVPNDCMVCSYLGGVSGHILRSTDHGMTWTGITNPIPMAPRLSLATEGENLFLGIGFRFRPVSSPNRSYSGVHYLPGGGKDWIPMNEGLKNQDIHLLKKLGGYLFAVTNRGTVYNLKLADLDAKTMSERTLLLKKGFTGPVMKIYSNRIFKLHLGTPPKGLIRLTLCNIRGQVIKRLRPAVASGPYITFSLNSSELPAGKYVLSAEFSDKHISAGIVVMK